MRARLPATMTARPAVTGFGQIAAQIKNSPSVASAGRAADRTESSTKASTASALGNGAHEMWATLTAFRVSGSGVLVSECDRSGSPDRTSSLAHVIHGDRYVEGAFAQIDRRDGEIRRRSGGARQIDDGAVIGLAVLERSKRCGASDFETLVHPLLDIRA